MTDNHDTVSGCPYGELLEGPLTDRLGNETQRLQLLYFLVTEVMAARLLDKSRQASQLPAGESDPAKELKSVLITLKFPRPPDNVTAQDLFQKVGSLFLLFYRGRNFFL